MIINLSAIEFGPKHFDFEFDHDWWKCEKEDSQILGLDRPLECHIDIAKAGVRYVLDGKIFTHLLMACDRCLEPFRHKLDLKFRLFLSPNFTESVQSEIELSEDDMSVQFVRSSEVDLNDIVREQIYLSLPMKSLCRKDCSGLCPICGTNLNKERCKCLRGEGHPGFSMLKALKLNGEH